MQGSASVSLRSCGGSQPPCREDALRRGGTQASGQQRPLRAGCVRGPLREQGPEPQASRRLKTATTWNHNVSCLSSNVHAEAEKSHIHTITARPQDDTRFTIFLEPVREPRPWLAPSEGPWLGVPEEDPESGVGRGLLLPAGLRSCHRPLSSGSGWRLLPAVTSSVSPQGSPFQSPSNTWLATSRIKFSFLTDRTHELNSSHQFLCQGLLTGTDVSKVALPLRCR